MRCLVLMLGLLCAAPASAVAQGGAADVRPLDPALFRSGTAGDLAALCAAKPDDASRVLAIGYCHGFLMAFGQTHRVLSKMDGSLRPFFCVPDPAPKLSDVAARFVSWQRANATQPGELAAEALLRFGAETYPCTRLVTTRPSISAN